MKKILAGFVAVILLFVAVTVGSYFLLDQKVIRQQVVQAVKQQSNLDLKMSRASFQLLPWPSFHAEELTLARPDCKPFITAHSAHADIAFLPLFHREIALQDFTVENGKASFQEGDDQSCMAWGTDLFSKKQDKPVSGQKSDPSSSAHSPWSVSFKNFRIKDTILEWSGKEGALSSTQNRLSIEHFVLSDLKTNNPKLDFKGAWGSDHLSLQGRLGPIHELLVPTSRPWVFSLGVTLGEKSGNDQLTADGVIKDIGDGGKATITLQGHSDTLQDWKNLFPQAALPDARNLEGKVTLEIGDDISAPLFLLWGHKVLPTAVTLHIGEVRNVFSSQSQPASMKDVALTATGSTAPMKIEGLLEAGSQPWHFMGDSGTLSQLAALRGGEEGASLPLDVKIRQSKAGQVADQDNQTQFQIQGQLGQQSSHVTVTGSGGQFQIPGKNFLPAFWNGLLSESSLRDFTFQTDVTSGPLSEEGKLETLSFDKTQIKSSSLNGEGTLALSRLTQSIPRFVAHFHFDRLDGNQFLSSSDEKKTRAKESGTTDNTAFPDNLIALSKKWDGLVDLKLDHFMLGDLTYRDLSFYGLMGDGKLTIDPLSAQLDDIPLKASFSLGQSDGKSYLQLDAQSLQLPAPLLLKLAHQKEFLEGNIQFDGQLSAEGRNRTELVNSLKGSLGISMTKGRIQKSVLMPLVGPAAGLLKLGKSSLKLRCLAGKFDFHSAQAEIVTLAMEAKHYALAGKGQINLPDQTLDMLLFPHIELADNEVSTPLQVTGSLNDPRLVPARNEQGYYQMNIGGSSDRDSCAEAVQAARGGHNGPVLEKKEKHESKVGGILKSLGIGGKF